ncbi:MAG: SdrD B-like domain-containing protein [Verrucomicrobiales bacterium]
MKKRFTALLPACAVLFVQSAQAQIDLSFANLVQATDGTNANFGPTYSGTTLDFVNVAPGSGMDIDLRVTVSNVTTNYYYSVSVPDYKSTTVPEPNGDLGYVYYHDDGLPMGVGGMAYNLQFYEGGGTFTTTTTLPAFRFLIYDVDGEDVQSESVRVFSADGFAGYGVSASGVTVENNGTAYLFTGLGSNVAEDDPSGALVLIYENTGKLTFQMESNTTADDGVSGDNPVFSAIDGDLSLIGGNTFDFEPFIRVIGSISGSVTTDANNDGSGDYPIAGVTLTLKDSSGNDIDSDPLTAGIQPFATTTDASGNYMFKNVPTGSFRVVQTQPVEFTSVSDTDGANNNTIGDENPIVVVADTDTPGNNFVEQAPQSITGTVVLDGDGNGIGEAPLAGILVQLLDDLGNPVDGDPGTSGVQAITTTTDANGDYYLPVPAAGSYIVGIDTADLPTPMPVSFDPAGALDGEGTVTVAAAENVIDVDFGYTGAVLTGNVFSDRDNDGSKGTEPGLSNVDLLITDSAAGTQTVTTDASGNYSVVVPLGSTNVDVVNGTVPNGYSLTTANDPQDVVVAAGGSVAAYIGYYNPQAVSGHLFHDIDGDGTQDANEPDLSGVTVFVEDSAKNIEVVVTDANGNYFVNVPTGSTILDVNDSTLPAGSALTTANDPQTVTVNTGTTTVSPSVGYTLPLLSVLKTVDTAGPVGIGASVDYTVNVFNNSTVTHTGIDVSDVLTNGAIEYGSGVNVSAPATGTLTTHIAENWNSDGYTGGTPTSGAPAWSGNWLEIGEADGATAGNIRVLLDGVGKRLQILGNATSSIGAQRLVDLSGMTSATVAFEYRRKNLDAAADYVTVEVSNDGTGWDEIGRISGVDTTTTTDTTYQVQAPITIPVTYLTDTARIRFVSSATMDGGDGDTIYIDDINIAANLVIAQTGSPGTTTPDLATDYIIDPGQSMSITYTATVDYSDGFNTITNVASATSDQQGTPESSSAGVAVANGSISGVVESDIDNDNGGDFGIGGVQLLLLDSAGNPIDDPSQPGFQDYIVTTDFGTGAYSFADVPAGSYRVSEVQPSGYVSVSDVDGANNNVIGDETPIVVSANTDSAGNNFLEERAASIGDRLWVDEDADGLQDAGEPGIAGVRVFLDANSNGALDDGEAWTVTDADGGYLFTDLAEGTYNVTIDTGVVSGTPPSGLTGAALASSLVANPTYNEDTGTTAPNHTSAVTVAVGEAHQTADFGYNYASVTETSTASSGALGGIGDRIWNDADADGVQDPGEAGIGGVTVSLLADPDKDGVYTATGTTTTTDASGNYFFDGLAVGSYKISVTPPAGYSATADLDGVGADGTDNITTAAIIVAPGDTFLNADFGYNLDAGGSVIGDTVYLDIDGDGVKDVTDPGIAGVSVVLLDSSGNVIATDTTDSSGNYSFPGLPDGTYTVWVNDVAQMLSQWSPTGDPDATLDGRSTVVVNSGTATVYNDEDFGFAPSGHSIGDGYIGDTVFLDSGDGAGGAANGSADAGEGIAGVVVNLFASDGTTLLSSTTTNANGTYGFGDLDPTATYILKIDPSTLPSGLSNTIDPDGSAPVNQASVDLNALGGSTLAQDFGYTATGSANSIAGTIWTDADANGVLDGSEAGDLSGVTVALIDASGTVIATATTDGSGNYAFAGLPDGTYTVVVTDVAGVLEGSWHSDGTAGIDNNSQNDAGYAVTVSGGATNSTADFGYYNATAGLGDFVWVDADGNGIQGSETGVPDGTKVTLTIVYPNTDSVSVVTTTVDGAYSFANLLADEDYNTATGASGADPSYSISFEVPANHVATPTGQGTVDTDSNGTSVLVASLTQGETDNSYDSGFFPTASYASVGNRVWNDLDGNGVYDSGTEAGIDDVTVQLFRSGDDPSSATPVGTATTSGGGLYGFAGLLPGDYFVFIPVAELTSGDLAGLISIPGSPDPDTDTTDDDDNGFLTSLGVRTYDITLTAGEVNANVDFGFAADTDGDNIPDAVEGTGDRDGDSVTNDLDFDPQGYFYIPGSGIIVPGGSVTATGPGEVTTLKTGADGEYQFTVANTTSGEQTYTLSITPPAGYEVDTAYLSGTPYNPTSSPVPNSLGAGEDAATGSLTSGTGTTFYTQLTLHPDDPLVINNNIPLKKKTLANFEAWETEFAATLGGDIGVTANGDGDLYSNLLEYALCLDPSTGIASHPPFCVEYNSVTGKYEASFIRQSGSHADISYTLEARDTYVGAGPDTVEWLTSAADMNVAAGLVTVTSNGDGTETVKHSDLETIAGMNGGEGYVRLRIDGTSGSINGETDYSKTFGWFEQTVGTQCETCGDPFVKKESFSGTIDSVNIGAGTIDVSTSVGTGSFADLINGAKNYYIEVLDGANEGHRLELDEAATVGGDGSTLHINLDVSTSTTEGNYNTDALADLTDLAGALIVLREHRVIDELFPVSDFVATNTHVSADRLLFFNAASSFNIYWAYDGSAHDDVTRWASRTSYDDQGQIRVIRPCEGFFIHPQNGGLTVRYVGMVRENALACPLKSGWNFVGNSWPADRQPAPDQAGVLPENVAVANDLGITIANGFTGSLSRSSSDQIQLWKADDPANLGAQGYTGYHLLNGDLTSLGLGVRSHWNAIGSTGLLDANGAVMLKAGRGMFLKQQSANDAWIIPAP